MDDIELFAKAVTLASIVKYSSDRMSAWSHAPLRSETIAIVTSGAQGLEVRQGERAVRCAATPAPLVRDTCGSGDMVSVGLIDHMLSLGVFHTAPRLDDVLSGIVAGQRLAAANCAFSGARGLFKAKGATIVRRLLDDPTFHIDLQLDLFCPVNHSAA